MCIRDRTEPVLERAFQYWHNVDADLGKKVEEAVRAGQGGSAKVGPSGYTSQRRGQSPSLRDRSPTGELDGSKPRLRGSGSNRAGDGATASSFLNTLAPCKGAHQRADRGGTTARARTGASVPSRVAPGPGRTGTEVGAGLGPRRGDLHLQLERAWDAWQDEKYRRGETSQRAAYTDNPFLPR